jgi:hypothetical protein
VRGVLFLALAELVLAAMVSFFMKNNNLKSEPVSEK